MNGGYGSRSRRKRAVPEAAQGSAERKARDGGVLRDRSGESGSSRFPNLGRSHHPAGRNRRFEQAADVVTVRLVPFTKSATLPAVHSRTSAADGNAPRYSAIGMQWPRELLPNPTPVVASGLGPRGASSEDNRTD